MRWSSSGAEPAAGKPSLGGRVSMRHEHALLQTLGLATLRAPMNVQKVVRFEA